MDKSTGSSWLGGHCRCEDRPEKNPRSDPDNLPRSIFHLCTGWGDPSASWQRRSNFHGAGTRLFQNGSNHVGRSNSRSKDYKREYKTTSPPSHDPTSPYPSPSNLDCNCHFQKQSLFAKSKTACKALSPRADWGWFLPRNTRNATSRTWKLCWAMRRCCHAVLQTRCSKQPLIHGLLG